MYVLEKGTMFAKLVEDSPFIDEVVYISAGKWRRYSNTSTLSKILDVKTNLLNSIDIGKTIFGFMQSLLLFKRVKPDVVFAKGGFVVVPVGYAARVFGTKLVTHDSDTSPGLANKIISKWAVCRTVASEVTARAYNNQKTKVVGIPINDMYQEIDPSQKNRIKTSLGVPSDKKLVVIIGGSQGAKKLNESMKKIMKLIISEKIDAHFCWIVGDSNELESNKWLVAQEERLRKAVSVIGYTNSMYEWLAASDVVITRGGATTLAELVASRSVAIIVPASFLPGDHQSDNARELARIGAAIFVDDAHESKTDTEQITEELMRLMSDETYYSSLKSNLRKIDVPDASSELARILISL